MHLRFSVWIVLIGMGWTAILSITSILLVMPLLVSSSRADEQVGKRPSGLIAMAKNAAKATKQVSLQTIDKGFYSGVRESLQIAISKQADWKDLWQRHTSNKSRQPALPEINFGEEMVVAVFLGDRPTGGYEVEIISAEQSESALRVSFGEKGPPPGAMTIQALTQPYHIVRVATDAAKDVVFRRLP